MKRAGPLLAVLLVVLADAVVLAGVAWNRRGEAESSLVLTERELPIAHGEKENTGMWLRLTVSGVLSHWRAAQPREEEPPAWSRPERMAELGFDCSVPPTDTSAEVFYSKALPLERYAVLEYEGDSWSGWLADRQREIDDLAREVERGKEKPAKLREARERLERERVEASRLFLIDVGRDPAALRRLYPERSRYIVAGAIVGLTLRPTWHPHTDTPGDPVLEGYVRELLVEEIYVPHDLRTLPEEVRRRDQERREVMARAEGPRTGPQDAPAAPRYAVALRYGRRHEPWIADVQPLGAFAADDAAGGP